MFSRLLTRNAKHKKDMYLVQVGSRMIAGLLFLALPVLLAGCSLFSSGSLSKVPAEPTRAMVADVPFYAQDELQCGPAALAMALNWSGIDAQPSDLSTEVYTPGLKGSLQSALIGSARRHGRVAYPITGGEALMAEVAAGHPVIVLVNLSFFWYPKWHYAVVIGYDQQQGEVVLHSGLTAREVLSSRTFMNIWQRGDYWGLLVLPPDRMPASVEEKEWLDAVAALENTGQWQTAAIGYVTALERWDKSFVAWMGLGNSKYNLHDLDASAKAFYQATLLQPENGMGFNNLAHVLAEQGQWQAALTAAQHAVDLGGPFIDTFRQTLEEVKILGMH
jgi:tetratricopeptide (TPR) repeat protein